MKKNFFLFLAALGLHCCVQAFSISVSGGCSLVVVHRLLVAVASPVAERGLQGTWTSVVWLSGSVVAVH